MKTNTNNEFCSNKRCLDYGRADKGNIQGYGKDINGKQRHKCITCGKVFVETKNTPFYRKRFTKDEIILICKLLVEKNSIRSIERITGHHRDTIGNLINDLAKHAKQVNDFLLNNVKLTQVQLDEFWTYIKKNKKNLSRGTLQMLETVTAT